MSNWNLTIQKMVADRKKEVAGIPVSPAQALKYLMADFDINAHKLALAIKVPPNRISSILKGERSISAETALRLGKAFGEDPIRFMQIQSAWELHKAKEADGGRINKEVVVL